MNHFRYASPSSLRKMKLLQKITQSAVSIISGHHTLFIRQNVRGNGGYRPWKTQKLDLIRPDLHLDRTPHFITLMIHGIRKSLCYSFLRKIVIPIRPNMIIHLFDALGNDHMIDIAKSIPYLSLKRTLEYLLFELRPVLILVKNHFDPSPVKKLVGVGMK